MTTKGNRTFIFALAALVFGLAALLLGLFFCLRPTAAPAGQMVFSAFALAVTGLIASLIAALAGRSSVEALSLGDGVKGAVDNLLTQKRPGEPAPPPAPAPTPGGQQ